MEEDNQRDKRTGEEAGVTTSEAEPKPKRSHRSIKCISEKDVGISAYVTEEKGIRGILKDSCEDFIVQEIDEQGHVVNLVNQEVPLEEQEEECKMSEEEGWKILHTYFDDSICQSIESFMNQVKADANTMEKYKLPSVDDKGTRKAIHGVIRCAFPCFVSDTEEDCIVLYSSKNQNVYHKTKRSSWPHPDKDYVKFTLKKKGKDTMNCINSIAHILHRAPKMFSYYGTKDKRAVTYQHVVAYRILPKDIKNAVDRLKDIEAGDFQFVAEPASIGKNQGNRFTILLHGVQENNKEDSVEELQQRLSLILSKLQHTGYLNYFGLQRFGHEGNNIPIGCHLLRSEWKEAFYKILRSGTNNIIEKAIAKFEESNDGVAAANLLPKFMSNEIILLKALGRSGGKGYSNAIAAIPFNRRSMYIHSIQSLLFNHFVSVRVAMGLSLLPGDFISTATENELTDKSPIIVITEENKKDYSIQQLVLPLPGLSTQLPSYLKEEYSRILKDLNLEEDCWSKCVQDYQMHGTYRRMLLIPKELEGSIQDDTLKLSFSLDSGCYATMLIREVTKYETDVKSQLALF